MAGWKVVDEPEAPKPNASPAKVGGGWKVAEDTPAPQSEGDTTYLGGLGRKAIQGVTLGYSDEMAAWLNSKYHGIPYEEALKYQRGLMDKDDEKTGKVGTAVEMVAGVAAPGFGTAKLGHTLLKGATGLAGGAAKVGYYGATGAGLGTVAAYGTQKEKDLAEAAKTGGTIGGVLGAATPLAVGAVRAVAPKLQDYTTRAREGLAGMGHRSKTPDLPMPISKGTQKAVAREMADSLENVGIHSRADYARRAQEVALPDSPDAYAMVGGNRVRDNLVGQAKEIRNQSVLSRPGENNYVDRFVAEQINPNGRNHLDRFTDDVFDAAGVQPGPPRDPVLARRAYDNLYEQGGNVLDDLRDAGGNTRLPGLRNLLNTTFGRRVRDAALAGTEMKGTYTREAFDTARGDQANIDFLIELRDQASEMAKGDSATNAKTFLRQLEGMIDDARARMGTRAGDVSDAYAQMRRAKTGKETFQQGEKLFTGEASTTANRIADFERGAARGDVQRPDFRAGAAHGVRDIVEKNRTDATKAREALLGTNEKRMAWNEYIPGRSGSPLTADAATRRLDNINDRVTFGAAIREALDNASVNTDDLTDAMFDAARTTQVSPLYGAALQGKYASRLVPQARRHARLRMGLDNNLRFKRGSDILGTSERVSPVELALREIEKNQAWRDGPKQHYVNALIQGLIREGVIKPNTEN